ncbi:hypothetical protein PDM28_17980 [Stenotrophomonas aracearum]|uniref:Lipoprotein n=1 Tax=Stenotrophomonas aracearum TaxID=3003272 RepID=A0ABY9YCC7_9GAMM|nr:hypothetical protein [Stenotrophomonas sp. A5588]WNH48523.1 hypothetical protein PDM28_17980 [Stenotrophomonas sp. A5588]
MSHHRSMTLLAVSLSILLAACKPDAAIEPANANAAPPSTTASTIAPEASEPAAPAATSADATANCAHADFDAFLPQFGREIALQEKSVANPLISERYDTQGEEPKLVTENVPLADVTWPVMPNPSGLKDMGREMQVSRQDDGSMKVLIRTPDTSNQQSYYFAQRPCWQLVRMTDESI